MALGTVFWERFRLKSSWPSHQMLRSFVSILGTFLVHGKQCAGRDHEDTLLMQLRAKNFEQSTCGDPSWYYNCSSSGPFQPYPPPCPEASTFAWCDTNLSASERATLLVAEMSLTELAEQVSCDIFGGVPSIPRLRVNSYNFIRENDHGLLWNNVCPIPTMFPCAISMGAAFNRTLWAAIGKAAAREARYNFHWGKQTLGAS